MSDLQELFESQFGDSRNTFYVRAPGRVNLIGEHVDYNDGFVLPIATPMSTRMRLRPSADRRVTLSSTHFPDRQSFALDHLEKQGTWLDYAIGVARELASEAVPLHGFEGVLESDVPTASGLSSSAALEVAVALAFTHLAEQPISAADLALLCQRAENRFIGVNCGIMDQMAVAACRADHALLLDCRSLETEQIPFKLRAHSIIVTDSGAPRSLAASAYNERRAQCESGLKHLQKFLPHIESLRDVAPEEFARHAAELPEIVQRRVRHIVSEIARTLQAAEYLKAGDLEAFGRAMNASHDSLRDDYEVSSNDLDWLVNWSRAHAGVLGSRLTGAGFGGCTVTLIENNSVEEYVQRLPQEYSEATGRKARCWVCTATAGATTGTQESQ
jgi:galactokinase